MAFRNEPVNSFQSVYKTSGDKADLFAVSCLTISDQEGEKVLLHICRPEGHLPGTNDTPIPSTPPASKHIGSLSQREIEVLKLLSDKMSTQDIAKTLSISIRTVRTHIQHLMYKLQVHKRIEAIKVGKQLKLI
jgi:LuxR family maltose regulon positive regulatory protein